MSLATLLSEIESAAGPVTGVELAARMGIPAGRVSVMLDALRASGRLGPEMRQERSIESESCSSAGSCSLRCPGPDECLLTVELSVPGLQIRSPQRSNI